MGVTMTLKEKVELKTCCLGVDIADRATPKVRYKTYSQF